MKGLSAAEEPAYIGQPASPRLKKPGLVVEANGTHENIASFLRDNGITKQVLKEYGFIVIKKIKTLQPGKTPHLLTGDHIIQWLHYDNPTREERSRESLVLHFPSQPNLRKAYTVLGVQTDIATQVINFLRDHNIAEDDIPEHVLAAIKSGSQDAICESLFSPDSGIDNVMIEKSWLKALYQYLKNTSYWHTWEADDALVIDEETMVHARLPFEDNMQGTDSYTINDFLELDL